MGEAQGKKVSNRHCGQATEAQPSFGQIKPSEAVLLVGPAAPPRRRPGGYRATATRGRAHWANEKKSPRADRWQHAYLNQTNDNAHSHRVYVVRAGDAAMIKAIEGGDDPSCVAIGQSGSEDHRHNMNGEAHASLVRDPDTGDDVRLAASPCPPSGAGENAMRIHAVAATTAAPPNAMASRQPSAGTAICASPRAA